jgi:NAD(P) transhydrogenase subunit alpha
VTVQGVQVIGPPNLAATVPHDASLLYARNVLAFLQHLIGPKPDGSGRFDAARADEILDATRIAAGGVLVRPGVGGAVQDRLPQESPA